MQLIRDLITIKSVIYPSNKISFLLVTILRGKMVPNYFLSDIKMLYSKWEFPPLIYFDKKQDPFSNYCLTVDNKKSLIFRGVSPAPRRRRGMHTPPLRLLRHASMSNQCLISNCKHYSRDKIP